MAKQKDGMTEVLAFVREHKAKQKQKEKEDALDKFKKAIISLHLCYVFIGLFIFALGLIFYGMTQIMIGIQPLINNLQPLEQFGIIVGVAIVFTVIFLAIIGLVLTPRLREAYKDWKTLMECHKELVLKGYM